MANMQQVLSVLSCLAFLKYNAERRLRGFITHRIYCFLLQYGEIVAVNPNLMQKKCFYFFHFIINGFPNRIPDDVDHCLRQKTGM